MVPLVPSLATSSAWVSLSSAAAIPTSDSSGPPDCPRPIIGPRPGIVPAPGVAWAGCPFGPWAKVPVANVRASKAMNAPAKPAARKPRVRCMVSFTSCAFRLDTPGGFSSSLTIGEEYGALMETRGMDCGKLRARVPFGLAKVSGARFQVLGRAHQEDLRGPKRRDARSCVSTPLRLCGPPPTVHRSWLGGRYRVLMRQICNPKSPRSMRARIDGNRVRSNISAGVRLPHEY